MTRSSFKIGSIWGIPIYLHLTFLLILPVIAWIIANNLKTMAGYAQVPMAQLSWSRYAWGAILAVALFASVLAHELGHSWVAMRRGLKARSITLMLFGGVAQLDEIPEKPGVEAVIAIAGPLTSAAVGGLCYGLVALIGDQLPADLAFSLTYLGAINLLLAVFNMIPAFPMDGGRVLRSLLARQRTWVEATRIATLVGKAFAVLFGIAGVFGGNIFLVVIAFFVYIGASQETTHAVLKASLDGLRVRSVMSTVVHTVNTNTPVHLLLEQMLRERHTGYPVLRASKLQGCVTEQDLQQLAPEQRDGAIVADIMSTEILSVRPEDDLYLALRRMSEHDVGRLMVLDDEELVGIVSRSDVMHGFKMTQLGGGPVNATPERHSSPM